VVYLDELKAEPEENIKSSGYVIDNIEAVVWLRKGYMKFIETADEKDRLSTI
jgi:hypothetical protein